MKENILIVGPGRSGTTSLFNYLSRHPDIHPSSVKETEYFLGLILENKKYRQSEYDRYFEKWNANGYKLESTPSYFLFSHIIAPLIFESIGSSKIIVILRNPIEKLYSLYEFHNNANRLQSISFEGYVERSILFDVSTINNKTDLYYGGYYEGNYYKHIKRWDEVFGVDNVKVVFFDDLETSPINILSDIFKWLDLEENFEGVDMIYNRTRKMRSRAIHGYAAKINSRLEPIFRKNEGLRNMLMRIYYFINSSGITNYKMTSFQSLYADKNTQLAEYLNITRPNIKKFPEWLSLD